VILATSPARSRTLRPVRRFAGWLVVCLASCGRIGFEPVATGDAPVVDAPAPKTGSFGPPQLLFALPVGASAIDDPTLTGDLLEMYFELVVGSTSDIYVVERTTTTSPWSVPVPVPVLSSPVRRDTNPEISSDGLTMHVTEIEEPPVSRRSSRVSRQSAWSPLVDIGVPGHGLTIDASNTLGVVHRSLGVTGDDLWTISRPTPNDPWGTLVMLTELNGMLDEGNAFLDPTGTAVFFERVGVGATDLVVASRASVSEPFGLVIPITELNTGSSDGDPWLSPDLGTIVFASDRAGTPNIYIAVR